MALVIQGNIANKEKELLEMGILKALAATGVKKWSIQVSILDRAEMISTNENLLNHSYATDIITIPYLENANYLESELFICIDVVIENARDEGVEFFQELERVGIHGILHLTGWNDKTPDEKKRMRIMENEVLESVPRGTR